MSTNEFLQSVIQTISKKKVLIAFASLFLAVLLFLLALTSKPVYTSRATVFPLTNQNENALTAGGLNVLLGIAEPSKSFSSEASINILELALSRNVRESVAATRLAEFGNKTIAELLIQSVNDNQKFYSKKIIVPSDSTSLVIKGAEILKPRLDAKVNKNGVLELYFSSANQAIIKPVSETIIAKISAFYINLRTQKATADYNFIVKKIDSLDFILNSFDRRAIQLQNTTLFTPDKLEYAIPKENLLNDKDRLLKQRDAAINNRDEALWRLQKVTPIIATLDKPTPPFSVQKKSPVLWLIIGLVAGALLSVIFVLRKILLDYGMHEIRRSIYSDTAS